MSKPIELSVDCGAGYSIVACFELTGGRYRQTITLHFNDSPIETWNDKYDSADPDWPQSAPIQQLSRENIEERPTLLGVGQAGRSHWSMSVEKLESGLQSSLRFDLACRTATEPAWLGSAYEGSNRTNETGCLSLAVLPDDAFQNVLLESNRITCKARVGSSATQGAIAKNTQKPVTYRWGYRIGIR